MGTGDWWCPTCQMVLDPRRVTFEERCDTCGTPVCVTGCGHEATIQAQAEQIAALDADIRQMVEKAADNSLEGYRELGRRAAEAENERDTLKAEVERLKACGTCNGTGIMDVVVRVEPPDEHEVTESTICAECDGTGKNHHAMLHSRLALTERVVEAAIAYRTWYSSETLDALDRAISELQGKEVGRG